MNKPPQFLEDIREHVLPSYNIVELGSFTVLTDLIDDNIPRIDRLANYGLKRVTELYPELNFNAPSGSWPMLLITEQEDLIRYYDFIAGDSGSQNKMIPGGVFVYQPEPHFVMPYSDFDTMDGAIAHELVHAACMMNYLPLWLEEGMAIGAETAMGHRMHPFATSDSREKLQSHYREVSTSTIFTKNAFSDAEESEFSYNLAFLMVTQLLKNRDTFFEFIKDTSWDDHGRDALSNYFDLNLNDLAHQSIFPSKPKGIVGRCIYWIFGV